MRSDPAVDVEAFNAFERAGWERAARSYGQYWEPLTGQAIEPVLDAARVAAGARVLDVACGTGSLAMAAVRRGASAIGMDAAAAMVAEARRRHPDLEFRQGDAENLPFGEGQLHAVVMNFGLLHLGRPDRALAEAHRILRPGGRVAFTVWAVPEEARAFGLVLEAVRSYGKLDVGLPPGPPFFRFAEPEECRRTLSRLGFASVTVARVPQVWRLPSAQDLFQAMYHGTVRTGGLLRAQSDGALGAIRAAVIEAAGAYETGGEIRLPMPAVLTSAARP